MQFVKYGEITSRGLTRNIENTTEPFELDSLQPRQELGVCAWSSLELLHRYGNENNISFHCDQGVKIVINHRLEYDENNYYTFRFNRIVFDFIFGIIKGILVGFILLFSIAAVVSWAKSLLLP